MFRIQEEAALTFHTSDVTPVCVQVLMSDTRCHSCPYSGAVFPGRGGRKPLPVSAGRPCGPVVPLVALLPFSGDSSCSKMLVISSAPLFFSSHLRLLKITQPGLLAVLERT